MYSLADHYFSSTLDYLQSQGIANEVALKAIKFNEYSDNKARQFAPRITLTSYNALLEYSQKTLNDPLFGFKLGQHIRTANFGILGYLIESSDSLASAIQVLLNYDSLVADIGKSQFEQLGDIAIIRWLPHPSCNEQVILRNMTAWVCVIRQLLNSKLSPSSICFTDHYSKEHLNTLATWFNCPVSINAKYNEISFPSSYLTLPFKTDNAAVHLALRQISEQQLSNFKSQQHVSEKINHMLMAKTDLQECDLIRTANALNITPRTLQRHLKLEQTSFAILLEQERKRRIPLLIGTQSLANLALSLGFKDQSSFNRAFKRWYSYSPIKYFKMQIGK
ncbi:AraC family transcriptional regulator [Pseudoalteromonas fuliginea]|uniref:AraC family transcriptional regulator n=1 Tax=Pseudoalteromonas fuliginea TaxID=1872678 RepID=A0AB73BGA9_9GAMM|nr:MULTISPECIES: AraC family transcriptional regulator [Pseudoalteromonas]ATG76625.1 transcriptional regulator [Pseudoalteromonas sp. 1_2015MBL_MicDiv]KAA1159811.1 AraC family transcriptional regulator [Pseudoalteromonas fuliginea]